MNPIAKRILGTYPIETKSISLLQMHISSLRDDLVLANNIYYSSEKNFEDFEEYDRAVRVILYQKAIANERIRIITKELKLRNIEVQGYGIGS